MAFDPILGDRIRVALDDLGADFTDKQMMGGLVFSLDEKMLCGIHIDKKYGESLLMCRIGEKAYDEHIERSECLPMDFTGRPMRGYIYVTPEGFDTEAGLKYWLGLAVSFNPQAKRSKRRKK